jgi:hypothetical protein
MRLQMKRIIILGVAGGTFFPLLRIHDNLAVRRLIDDSDWLNVAVELLPGSLMGAIVFGTIGSFVNFNKTKSK